MELNRQILHPLGLAAVMVWDEESPEAEAWIQVLDRRSDPEGMTYDDWDDDLYARLKQKEQAFHSLWLNRIGPRQEALGYVVQKFREGK